MVPAVVCVLRSGGEFTPAHVIALYKQVLRHWPRHLPLRFVALTDTLINFGAIEERQLRSEWPRWWAKMELFAAQQDDLGDILYMDLDTAIVGPLDGVIGAGQLTLLSDFYKPARLQSGLMYLPKADRPEVMSVWLEGPEAHAAAFKGDGDFLDSVWADRAARWQDVLPGQVCSYKVHCRRRGSVPAACHVVCFHGKPRPWDTALWRERIA